MSEVLSLCKGIVSVSQVSFTVLLLRSYLHVIGIHLCHRFCLCVKVCLCHRYSLYVTGIVLPHGSIDG